MEEHLFAFTIAVDALIIPNSKHVTISFHYVEDLNYTMILLVNTFFLVAIKNKLTVLPPIARSLKIKHRSFRITGMEKQIL